MSKTAILVAVAALAAGAWLGSPSFDGSSSSSASSSAVRPVLGRSHAPVSKPTATAVVPIEAALERDGGWGSCHRHEHPRHDGALVGPSDKGHQAR